MVAMMASSSRERLARLANSAQTAADVPSKLDILQKLKLDLSLDDATLLSELLPRLFDLQSDRFSPVRKFVTQMLGDIGVEQMDLLPDIVPVLLTVLQDGTPAVARQAITCAINLFRSTLIKVAVQGLYSSELDDSVESSWAWMLKFKEKLYSIAFQPGSDGIRLLALKFVEAIILLYTPNPNGSVEPPPPDFQGKLSEFNVSWLRGGHPVLNIGDMSVEASQSLGLLLDQLRYPTVKSLSNSMILVLINSLSAIANKRPTFYGRILPVLLGLDSVSSVNKGVRISGTQHALRRAFISCLDCTHPSAAPWRDRLVGALREMKVGELPEQVLNQVCRSNGNMDGWKDDSRITMDEKPFLQEEKPPVISECDAVHGNSGKKRSATEDTQDVTVNDDVSGKRLRTTPNVSEGSTKELSRDTVSQDDSPGAPTTSREVDNGPVQQLIAMFGALVAQGEKAIGSIEILISSISADLLADVVMTNMRYLPPNRPKVEGEDELLSNMSVVAGDTQVKYPPSFLTNILALSRSFPQIVVPLIDTHQLASDDTKPSVEEEVNVAGADDNSVVCPDIDLGDENLMPSTGPVAANDIVSAGMGDQIPIPSDVHDVENLESGIPGLDSSVRTDGLSETLVASSLASTDIEEASQEQVTSSDRKLPLDLLPSISADRSEEHSSKATATDVNSLVSSTATSTGLSYHFVLPKISAPVVVLDDDQRDHLQKLAFTRIIEAYKQVAVAGGAQVRSSLLAYLAVEFPLELDQWKVLQKHISADYINHEGHELTMRVLYRLFRESEEDRDFFSSANATSVYETFLLNVAETLRDSFPPSDKSLSRLLGEAPYLPQSVLKLLECLCSPGHSDKSEKELQNGDRVTQGLSTVWSLILLRPPIREASLKIALQSAVHHLEEVRMKAIRLVANKLYPLSSISQQIEDFAQEKLLTVMNSEASEGMDIEESVNESQKGSELETPTNDHHSTGAVSKDTSCDTHQSGTSQSLSHQSISDAQRYMSLYFALCTKKHSLFRKIFVVYKSTSKAVKQGVHRHIPILVRTMGSSTELLEIISDPPSGSENLLLQVLQTLTDGMTPSPELIHTIRKLYEAKIKDVEILIPILPFLPKDEVLLIFPNLVNLPPDKFQAALTRILQGSSHSGPVLTPAEVLIAIHGIDPEKDGIPLKKVTDACNACFVQHQIFTQQVIAKVLNQLVEQIPLPLLFMRTVLQAIGAFPALVDFIMEILSRLVSKQIWKFPKLWVGFLKCASLTKPQSFSVLLQLPPAQLENALNRMAGLKPHLVAHASQPHIRSTIPRSLLVVLGIAPDSQAQSSQVQQFSQAQSSQAQQSSQAHSGQAQQSSQVHSGQAQQSSQAHSGQAQQSGQAHSGQAQQSSQAHSGQAQQSGQAHSSQAHSGQAQQSSQAQSGQAHSGQAQQSSQTQSGQAHSGQAQSGQAQTGDTSNSERDATTENPKDSSDAS